VFSTSDTIVAIATPAGRGGLGVIRVSGPDASRIACELVGRTRPLKARHATFARFADSDQVVVTSFPAPRSYTGEDVAEISAHGSPVVLSAILRRAMECGARLAEPGEFTLRAFLNGKLDLIQAEAVADLIDAVTPLQARAAFDQLEGTLTAAIGAIEKALFDVVARLEASLDFPDEGYHFVAPQEARDSLAGVIADIDSLLAQAERGRLIREGAQVAIAGAPNVGKSSLFNALLNANRAIVTAVPGTTRDLLTERADIGGLSLALIDTAGVRETSDIVEQEGVSRARDTLRVADLILVVLDRSRPLNDDDRALLEQTAGQARVIVVNKCDLPEAWRGLTPSGQGGEGSDPVVPISVLAGSGLDELIAAIARALSADESLRDRPAVTNLRHAMLLQRARAALLQATSALEGSISEEFPLLDLQEAGHALQEITGRRTTDDLLQHIFKNFCIGK
jgi:tRNA modification GTPase